MERQDKGLPLPTSVLANVVESGVARVKYTSTQSSDRKGIRSPHSVELC